MPLQEIRSLMMTMMVMLLLLMMMTMINMLLLLIIMIKTGNNKLHLKIQTLFISLCDVVLNEGIESLIFIMGRDLHNGCRGVKGKVLYNTGRVGGLAEDWGMVIGVNNGDVELEHTRLV